VEDPAGGRGQSKVPGTFKNVCLFGGVTVNKTSL